LTGIPRCALSLPFCSRLGNTERTTIMNTPMVETIRAKIEAVHRRKHVVLSDGTRKQITGAVRTDEAARMAALILERQYRSTLETGVAFGVSTLAICLALDAVKADTIHYGVDPEQWSVHQGAAVALHDEHGIQTPLRILEGCSHEVLPALLKEGVQLDFAFIDGWHTFDYTLLDFFYIDKLLKPRGVVAFHDCWMPSKRKVLRYITTHRKYRLLPYPKARLNLSLRRLARSALRGSPDPAFFLARRADLLMLEKLENWEPNFDYFENF